MKNSYTLLLSLIILTCSQVFGGDTLRIASYNILNYSDTSTRHTQFRKVIHNMKPDVLVVQEIINQAGVTLFLNQVMNYYQPGKYATVQFYDGPDTDNSIFYDTSKVKIVNVNYLTNGVLTRFIAEYTIKPKWSDESLRIYSLHLKAGASDTARRRQESEYLRDYLNQLQANTNFIIAGDYNIYGGTEAAYQTLIANTSDNDGRVKDPLNMTGTWNQSAYAAYHTQAPQSSNGGMDDRFDMLLPSYSLYEDNMIVSSYKAFGNDGQHYNASINRLPNYAVPDSVAHGLYYAADHIPVVCNFTFPDTVASVSVSMNVATGWNIVSLPIAPNNPVKTAVFPNAGSNAYYYNNPNGYFYDVTLRSKVGYWIKFNSFDTIQVLGKVRGSDTINVTTGWNLIGASDHDVAVSQLNILPTNIIDSPFYGFDLIYQPADTIRKGRGYFVKVNTGGKIIIP
ncbi:MAG: endonuclease/exonuclease/phosphatase family protein [Ignavibacteriae bacterium]|nr:endonuclease/exonuclease/phosphatase family protein [Ignavibacteriota bacterium]